MLIRAFARARLVASTGPRPMISGERPETPVATIRASGVTPRLAALASDMMTTAAAPSLSGQLLPAVTMPSGRKAGCSLWVARSSGRASLREPLLARPMGEREVETITASGMGSRITAQPERVLGSP